MAIADRARDFWDRISPRERRLVVIAAIAAPITIAIWLSLAIHDGLVAMEHRNDKMRKALLVVDDMKARGSKPVTPDDFSSMVDIDPVILNKTSLETYLTNAATKAGFVLKAITPHNPVTRNGFVTSSVSCGLSDLTIDQLKKFLQDVETSSKIVVVTHLDIHRREFKGKDKLDASLEVSTYAKEKKAEDPKAGSGSASGSDKKGT
jgi:hypothetical protein